MKRWLILAAICIVVIVLTGVFGGAILSRYAQQRAVATLQKSYSGLQVTNLRVRLFPGIRVSADEIILPQHDRTGLPPFISIKRVSARATFVGVLRHPLHIAFVRLEGLEIHIPPRREGKSRFPVNKDGNDGAVELIIDELKADGTKLEILPKNANKQPLDFDIRELTINDAGTAAPMKFRAILTNAKPPGDIHSTGKLGPLQLDDPAVSPVEGSYTFKNADLSVFKGIAGILSSEGKYQGSLDHIGVQGQTDTPNFTVRVSDNPVRLTTQFQAVVDGMNGNTYLNQVNGHLGRTSVTVSGAIDGTKGVPGKTVNLNAVVSQGRLEDLLLLGVKGKPPMSGAISFHSKILIPPGPVDIPGKLHLDGQFNMGEARFKELNVQERLDKLSDRGRGDPEGNGGDVVSNFQGGFTLDAGVIKFDKLSFHVPGVQITLDGTYGLLDEKLDMHGTARLEAKVSETVTGFKSFLLKAIDPIFSKKGAGAVLPIKIGGTRTSPAFGLDEKRTLEQTLGGSSDSPAHPVK